MAFGSDATITLSIVAKDLASGNIGKAVAGLDALAKKGGLVGSVAQGVGQSFGQMLNPIGLVSKGIGIVTDFLQEGVQSAIAEEASLKRLDTALKDNVTGWNGDRSAIDQAIDARMRLGFEDDTLRDSMIKLVTATKNGEEAIRLQGLAMDIARGKNIDLAAATDIVVKASVGNIGALKRMGVEIRDGATATEILAELQKTFSGQATEYANTTAGALQGAQVAIGEVAEDIGTMLVPAIRDAAKWTRDELVPAIKDTIKFAGDLGNQIGDLVDKIPELKDVVPSNTPWDAALESAQGYGKGILDILNSLPAPFGGGKPSTLPTTQQGWVAQWTGLGQSAGGALNVGVQSAYDAGASQLDAYMAAQEARVRAAAPGLAGATAHWMNEGYVSQVDAATAAAKQIARTNVSDMMTNITDVLRGNKSTVKGAMDDLEWLLEHPLKQAREVARLEAELTGPTIAEGLASGNPAIKRQTEYTLREVLVPQWEKMTGASWDWGISIVDNLERAISTFKSPQLWIDPPKMRSGGAWAAALQGYVNSSPRPRGNRAAGGPAEPHGVYRVGEHNEETLIMGDQGGVVLPKPAESYASRGGGEITVHVHIHSAVPPSGMQMQAAAQALVPELTREMRRQRILG